MSATRLLMSNETLHHGWEWYGWVESKQGLFRPPATTAALTAAGALSHASMALAARSNTAWVPANLFISQVFWASNSQIDPRTCARSEARAVAAWDRVPARMVRL